MKKINSVSEEVRHLPSIAARDGKGKLNIQEAIDLVADKYKLSKNADDYEYMVLIALHADEPNSNGDAFPLEELERFDEKYGCKVYQSFTLKPSFIEHRQDGEAYGFVLDSHLEKPENETPYVELCIAIDATKDPVYGEMVRSGKVDKFSMGCSVDYTTCNVCGNTSHDMGSFCDHIKNSKMSTFKVADENGDEVEKLAYENCFGVVFDEISAVGDPADGGAVKQETLKAAKRNIKMKRLNPDKLRKGKEATRKLRNKVVDRKKVGFAQWVDEDGSHWKNQNNKYYKLDYDTKEWIEWDVKGDKPKQAFNRKSESDDIQIGSIVKPLRYLKRPQSSWLDGFGKGKLYEVMGIDKLDDGENVLVLKTGPDPEMDYSIVYPDEVRLISSKNKESKQAFNKSADLKDVARQLVGEGFDRKDIAKTLIKIDNTVSKETATKIVNDTYKLKSRKISSTLKQKYRNETRKKEWALVSKSNPDKVLKWFGATKPSDEAVAKEEKRVQYFKNQGRKKMSTKINDVIEWWNNLISKEKFEVSKSLKDNYKIDLYLDGSETWKDFDLDLKDILIDYYLSETGTGMEEDIFEYEGKRKYRNKKAQNTKKEVSKKYGNYSIEVIQPEGKEWDVTGAVINFVDAYIKKYGLESFEMRMDTILMDFAQENGLIYDREDNNLIFKEPSLSTLDLDKYRPDKFSHKKSANKSKISLTDREVGLPSIGDSPVTKIRECQRCKGTGEIETSTSGIYKTCPDCGGMGRIRSVGKKRKAQDPAVTTPDTVYTEPTEKEKGWMVNLSKDISTGNVTDEYGATEWFKNKYNREPDYGESENMRNLFSNKKVKSDDGRNEAFNLGYEAGKEDGWMFADRDSILENLWEDQSFYKPSSAEELVQDYWMEGWESTDHFNLIHGKKLQRLLKSEDAEYRTDEYFDLKQEWWEGALTALNDRGINVYGLAKELIEGKTSNKNRRYNMDRKRRLARKNPVSRNLNRKASGKRVSGKEKKEYFIQAIDKTASGVRYPGYADWKITVSGAGSLKVARLGDSKKAVFRKVIKAGSEKRFAENVLDDLVRKGMSYVVKKYGFGRFKSVLDDGITSKGDGKNTLRENRVSDDGVMDKTMPTMMPINRSVADDGTVDKKSKKVVRRRALKLNKYRFINAAKLAKALEDLYCKYEKKSRKNAKKAIFDLFVKNSKFKKAQDEETEPMDLGEVIEENVEVVDVPGLVEEVVNYYVEDMEMAPAEVATEIVDTFVEDEAPEEVVEEIKEEVKEIAEAVVEEMEDVGEESTEVIEEELEGLSDEVDELAEEVPSMEEMGIEEEVEVAASRKSKEQIKAYKDKFHRALKVAATRQLLNIETSGLFEIKDNLCETMISPNGKFAGLKSETALDIIERSFRKIISSGAIGDFIKSADKLMEMDDSAFKQIESDVKSLMPVSVRASIEKEASGNNDRDLVVVGKTGSGIFDKGDLKDLVRKSLPSFGIKN